MFAAVASALVAVFVGAGLGLAALAGVPASPDGLDDPLWDTALGFGTIAILLPAVALTVRWAGGRSLGSISSVAGHLRRPRLVACLTPASALVGVQVVVLLAVGGSWDPARWPGWGAYGAVIAISVALVPLQAAAEEYVTRGWLVQTLSSVSGSRWIAAALSCAVFVSLHATLDPWALADLTVFAVALSWLTFRTGGLEAALVLHVVVNMVYTLVAATQGIPDLGAEVSYRAWDALPGIAVTLAYSYWIARRATRMGSAPTRPG